MLTNSSRTEIDTWFIEGSLAGSDLAVPETWEPIFDADRQLVHTKIGPYWRLFIRPESFTKRFYHHVYPLAVENWQITRQIQLYDGFCTIDVELDIRFQATLKYALNNMDNLSGLNDHIKAAYEDLLINLIDKELLNLSDGAWVQKGATDIEKKISFAVSEMLILQNIQSQTLCSIKPWFADFPDVQLAKDNVYLCVLKKSFEFNEAKRTELFRQEQETEKQKLEHKRKQLEQLNRDGELERLTQSQQALNRKLLLEEKEQQLLEQFEIEKRLHAAQIAHDNSMKEITQEAELQEQQKHDARQRIAEQNAHLEALTHQAKLKAQELEAEIAEYEHQQARWRESRDKVHAEQIALEQRQKQLEFDTETENQKRRERKRLEIQKESYDQKKEADVYLHREIELLALEKQRLELQSAIEKIK
ncbi:hypothetical protein [Candidatus Methylobacter oryzae]|uniref:Band 7 domain-containing protein n=1 Tax=Candidatus Methylobacter oryzae TaxID=2497749 RepID=A0ABY3CGI1_9GAMM|nr:hypothetical protein [Candidatus Methylobacter oryzae]TRX02995.1 hypothetical protein EKO24_001545 [Candidatus Methylobacter oryzae]